MSVCAADVEADGLVLTTVKVGFVGTSGFVGYSGDFGASGFVGYSGDFGASGFVGISGFVGTSGFAGYSGGPVGFSGSAGTVTVS